MTDCEEHGGVCDAHSGTVTGIKGLYALLTILIGLVGTQMLFQIPSIRLDILTEIKGVTARIVELEKKDIEICSELAQMKSRLQLVESKTAVESKPAR